MQNDMLAEITNTLTELRRMHQLNLELLEQLNVSCSWLMEHNIPIPNASTLSSLLSKTMTLLAEIQSDTPKVLQYQKIADEKKQPFRTDEEEPVPKSAILNREIPNLHNTAGEFNDIGKVQSNRFRPRSWNVKSCGA